MNAKMFTEDLLISQKKISIYKALNGDDISDLTLATYIEDLAGDNFALGKFDDSLRSILECEKIYKKLPQDAEVKKRLGNVEKFKQ